MKINFKNISRTALEMITGFIQRFIFNTDLYLHYANQIMFDSAGTRPVIRQLFLRLSNLKVSIAKYIAQVFIRIRASITSFLNDVVNVNSFEGVIERYCGVPP